MMADVSFDEAKKQIGFSYLLLIVCVLILAECHGYLTIEGINKIMAALAVTQNNDFSIEFEVNKFTSKMNQKVFSSFLPINLIIAFHLFLFLFLFIFS